MHMSIASANTRSKSQSGNSVVVNAGWLTVGQVARRALRLGVFLLVARLLGSESFGAYALLLTVVELVALISGYSYGDFLAREVARQPETAWPLAKKITQIRLAYGVPCVAIALLLLAALRFPASMVLNAALFSLALIPRAIGESAQGIVKGLQRFRLLLWVELAQGAILLFIAPLLILKGFGIKGVIVAEILAALGGALVSLLAIAPTLDFTASHQRSLRDVARSTVAFNVYPFIVTIYDRVDVVLLSRLAGNVATGIYALPYRVFASLSIVPYGMMGALLPVLSSSGASQFSALNQEMRQHCGRAMKFLYLAALLAVLMALAFARPVILAILGQGYSGSIVTIKILAWASVPVFLNHALNVLLLAARKEKIFIWTASICTAFNVSANLVLIPRFSYLGAAVVTLLTELLLLVQNCYLITKYLGQMVFPQDAARITAVFLLILAGFLALRQWVPEIVAGVAACAVFALFAIRIGKGLLYGPKAIGHWQPETP